MADIEIRTQLLGASGFEFTVDLAGPRSGELVLLLHGYPQTRHTWRRELIGVAAAGLRACAPDQRGYSAGARPAGIEAYRIEHLVDDVLRMADTLDAERFHLVGHDWGGHLAWITAALHPTRVKTLAVISRPHPAAFVQAMTRDAEQSTRSGHHRAYLRAEATDELLRDNAAKLRAIYAHSGVPDCDADVYLETLGSRDTLDAAVNWYRAAADSKFKAAEIPAVTAPTLYVWGNADATVGRAAAELTRTMVAAPFTFVELPNVGHFVTDQSPDAFPPLLMRHMRSHGDVD